MIDSAAATAERTVLYYQPLLPVGEETDPFSDILVIDPAMAEAVTETKEVNGDYTVIRRTYDYDGCQFVLEVRADAVQTHNAEEAILSAWGQKMSVRDGRLSFKEAE